MCVCETHSEVELLSEFHHLCSCEDVELLVLLIKVLLKGRVINLHRKHMKIAGLGVYCIYGAIFDVFNSVFGKRNNKNEKTKRVNSKMILNVSAWFVHNIFTG